MIGVVAMGASSDLGGRFFVQQKEEQKRWLAKLCLYNVIFILISQSFVRFEVSVQLLAVIVLHGSGRLLARNKFSCPCGSRCTQSGSAITGSLFAGEALLPGLDKRRTNESERKCCLIRTGSNQKEGWHEKNREVVQLRARPVGAR